MTIWWYIAARAAPMNGPTQKIHCEHEETYYYKSDHKLIKKSKRTSNYVLALSLQLNYLVIPSLVHVVDDGSSKASGRVDASSCNGDGGQVNQEHCKPNWKRSQNLHSYIPS